MRFLATLSIFILCFDSNSQSFYEKIMAQNISIADTSYNSIILERSVRAFERISHGYKDDWAALYYNALCYTRMADINLAQDSNLTVKMLLMARQSLKKASVVSPNHSENKLLEMYIKVNELKLSKKDLNKVILMEEEILGIKSSSPLNPRANTLYAYYYLMFYSDDKVKKKKAKELLMNAILLYDNEKLGGFDPSWGKTWNRQLLNSIIESQDSIQKR